MKQGYTSEDFLPDGWLYKKPSGSAKVQYITPEYTRLHSNDLARKYMMEKRGMEEYLVKFREHCRTMKAANRGFKSSTVGMIRWEEEENLPFGWKSAPFNKDMLNKQNKKLRKYQSPDGNTFNSKPAAIRFMISNDFSPSDV